MRLSPQSANIQIQEFIPFQYRSSSNIRSEPLTYHRKKWLRQRKNQQYESYQQQLLPRKISIQHTQQTRFFDHKYIRYSANEEQIMYICDSQLSSKAQSQIMNQNEMKDDNKQTSEDLFYFPPNFYKNQHRYFTYNTCNYCKQKGHQTKRCNKLNKHNIYMGAYICYYCNKRGHIAKFCPKKRQNFIFQFQYSQGTQTTPRKGPIFQITASYTQQFDY